MTLKRRLLISLRTVFRDMPLSDSYTANEEESMKSFKMSPDTTGPPTSMVYGKEIDTSDEGELLLYGEGHRRRLDQQGAVSDCNCWHVLHSHANQDASRSTVRRLDRNAASAARVSHTWLGAHSDFDHRLVHFITKTTETLSQRDGSLNGRAEPLANEAVRRW